MLLLLLSDNDYAVLSFYSFFFFTFTLQYSLVLATFYSHFISYCLRVLEEV